MSCDPDDVSVSRAEVLASYAATEHRLRVTAGRLTTQWVRLSEQVARTVSELNGLRVQIGAHNKECEKKHRQALAVETEELPGW